MFKPIIEECEDIEKYNECQGMCNGIVEVTYPKEWCVHLHPSSILSVSRPTIYNRVSSTFERQPSLGAYSDGRECIAKRTLKAQDAEHEGIGKREGEALPIPFSSLQGYTGAVTNDLAQTQ